MKFEIRSFTPDDYPAMTDLLNTIYPDNPRSAEQWREDDENRDAKCQWHHFVAEVDGRIVAVGSYLQNIWMYHPQKFDVFIDVSPQYRHSGIGTALYQRILEDIRPFEPISLRSRVREDMVDNLHFLHRRGFREIDRDWESRLDPSMVDLAPYRGLEQQLAAEGIVIKTLEHLREVDSDYARKVYELDWSVAQDIPMAETLTQPPFDDYVKNVLQRSNLLPDAWFIAVDGDRYVGLSSLWINQADPSMLNTGFTGVHRNYRRKGIALALKVRAVAYAQAHGNPTLKTWNNQKNRPMLSINERLGFVKLPAWITFTKEIKAEAIEVERVTDLPPV